MSARLRRQQKAVNYKELASGRPAAETEVRPAIRPTQVPAGAKQTKSKTGKRRPPGKRVSSPPKQEEIEDVDELFAGTFLSYLL